MTAPNKHSLSHYSVLVTRPQQQAEGLCQAIQALGGHAILFPVLEIKPTLSPEIVQQQLNNLSAFDIGIFISANAVNYTFSYISSLPSSMKIAAIGKATASTLNQHCSTADISLNSGLNSEALLKMPLLNDVAGKSIVIFRGESGREMLADTLKARGADVTYIEVYRRELPVADVPTLLADWDTHGIDAVVITSLQSLINLQTLLGDQGRLYLQKTAMVVISERLLEKTSDMGITKVVVASEASDDAIVAALIKLQHLYGKNNE